MDFRIIHRSSNSLGHRYMWLVSIKLAMLEWLRNNLSIRLQKIDFRLYHLWQTRM